jgi:UDP-glucose 4-epimerase
MPKIDGKTVLVTGGAGFIGSNFVERILGRAGRVIAYDNLSSGRYDLIKGFIKNRKFRFVKGDVLDYKTLSRVMKEEKPEVVIHFAANPDIQRGTKETDLDIQQGPVATHNLLEAARQNSVKSILYSSTSAIYGMANVKPTPENYGPLKPISLYAASKLACEGLITAYGSLYGMNYYIYRFANIVGRNQTHGVIVDFIHKLKKNPKSLEVLGNGKQRKAYMDVVDCVDAMVFTYENAKPNQIINLATSGQTSVAEIARQVIARVSPEAKIRYTGTRQGWPGDVTNTHLDNTRMLKLGIRLKYERSNEVVKHAIEILTIKTHR